MAKKPRAHHKKQVKWLVPAFIGLIVLLVALLVVNAFLPKTTTSNSQLSVMITEEGHVHTTDGQHVGTYEEVFGQPWEEVAGNFNFGGETTEGGAETAPADGEAAPAGEDAAAPAAE